LQETFFVPAAITRIFMSTSTTTTAPQLDVQWILDHLVSRTDFQPVPHPATHREAWEAIAGTTGKHYIEWADANMDYGWPHVLATQLMAYGRDANRVAMEQPYFERRMALQYFVMTECLTWQGKYLDKIIDGLWTICEETYWCFPPHMGANRDNLLPDVDDPILDLFASYTGQQMAWTVWFLQAKLDAISPEVCKQVRRKVKQFVLDAIIDHPRHWLGLDPKQIMNNWTPWICATWLSSAWILEDEPAKFEMAVNSICKALNIFMSQQPEDGGCDEGVMYWPQAGGALYECLDQLGRMTGGKAMFMDHPLLQKLAQYPQIMHIAKYEYACFADGRAVSKTMPGYWISKWALDMNDTAMLSFGDYLAREQMPMAWSGHCNFYRQIQRPFIDADVLKRSEQPIVAHLDHWLPDTQVMTARSQTQSGQGWHVSAKGGHNAESHNHNDVGQLVVYHNGHSLLIDLGVETYSGKTFSAQRYDIFTMQSQWHNLPTFGDAVQLPGREYAAKNLHHQVVEGVTTFSLDIADAYAPQAALQSYVRQITLDRKQDWVRMTDTFSRDADGPVTLSLITVSKVQVQVQQLIFSPVDLPHDRSSAAATITWDGVTFDSITVEEKAITDTIMLESWGKQVYRVKLTVNAAKQGAWQFTIKHV
jgi:hypothetical protein